MSYSRLNVCLILLDGVMINESRVIRGTGLEEIFGSTALEIN